jgi:nitrate reductase NapAB chaperone NapD
MIFASGVVEITGGLNINSIVNVLKSRGLEIDNIEGEKVIFQIERNTIGDVKSEMNLLKGLDGINNVHITYYSLEDGDDGRDM